MPVDWSSFKDEIYSGVLTEMGNTFTLKVPKVTIDTTTKKKVTTYEEYTGTAVMGNYTEEASGVSNTIIQAGDVKFIALFDDTTFVPLENKGEIITFGTVSYSVIHVKQINPDSTVTVVWIIQGRKVG